MFRCPSFNANTELCEYVITADDAAQAKALQEMSEIIAFSDGNTLFGEMGIPNDRPAAEQASWNALMDKALDLLRCEEVGWLGWAGGKWWGDYQLEIYDYNNGQQTPTAIAGTFENYYGTAPITGINWSGYEFANAPEVWQDFTSAPSDFAYLASRGVQQIRLPVHWCDAVDGNKFGPIKQAWQDMLCALLDAAQSAGIGLIIDIHEYGGFCADDPFLNCSDPLTNSGTLDAYLDFLTKMFAINCSGVTVANHPALFGFDIMNEPACVAPASAWESISQQIVTHVRSIGYTGMLFVPTWFYSGRFGLEDHVNGPWINDSNFSYTNHYYFQDSGAYNLTYAEQVAQSSAEGYSAGDTYVFMKPC